MTRIALPFDQQCRYAGLPVPAAEYRFHPTRKWRFDWAFVSAKVAVEVQGGIFVQGRHSRGAGLLKEHEKLNAAAELGWRVLFCTPKQVNDGSALTLVQSVIGPEVGKVDVQPLAFIRPGAVE